MPKKVLIALPPSLLEQADFVANIESRTRSDLLREALRRYLDNFRQNQHTSNSLVEPMPLKEPPPLSFVPLTPSRF